MWAAPLLHFIFSGVILNNRTQPRVRIAKGATRLHHLAAPLTPTQCAFLGSPVSPDKHAAPCTGCKV